MLISSLINWNKNSLIFVYKFEKTVVKVEMIGEHVPVEQNALFNIDLWLF